MADELLDRPDGRKLDRDAELRVFEDLDGRIEVLGGQTWGEGRRVLTGDDEGSTLKEGEV